MLNENKIKATTALNLFTQRWPSKFEYFVKVMAPKAKQKLAHKV